jgi:glycosyltransferase involved in cell wall biosynthesis
MSNGAAIPDLSVVVLCYRAGEFARQVVVPLHGELTRADVDFELVLVGNFDADAGPDETPAAIERIAAELPRIRTVAEPKQGGMGWDMRCGLGAATGKTLVVIDGDGQFDHSDVLRAYRTLLESDAAVVKGRRIERRDGAWRGIQSAVYNLLFRVLFPRSTIRDVNSKPKAMTRSAYEQLDLVSDDWFVDAEIMLQAQRNRLEVAEIPVVFAKNPERNSFVRLSTVGEFLRHLFRYRLLGRP